MDLNEKVSGDDKGIFLGQGVKLREGKVKIKKFGRAGLRRG